MMLAKLLHIANSDPPSNECLKKRFYDMKNRILHRWGKPDGSDLQAFKGKPCWSCEGTGGLYEPHGCYKCDGTGWYKSPRIVQLKRWKFGGYVFHEPGLVIWREAKQSDNIKFHGRVEHTFYRVRTVLMARILLGLIYDRGFAWHFIKAWVSGTGCRLAYILNALRTRHCSICYRRILSWKSWRCKACDRKLKAPVDEDVPF